MADRPDVSALLDGLDPYAPYELWLSNLVRPALAQPSDATPAPLRPSALTASARAIVDGQRTTILALVNPTADDAVENAARLRRNLTDGSLDGQPWSDRFASWTVTAGGRLTLAVIDEGDHPPASLAELDQLWRSAPP